MFVTLGQEYFPCADISCCIEPFVLCFHFLINKVFMKNMTLPYLSIIAICVFPQLAVLIL